MADKKESVEVKTEKTASSEQSDDAADTAESSGSNAVTSAVSGVKSAVSSAVTGAYGAVIGVFSKFASSIGIPTKILALLLSVVTVASAVVISDSQTYNKSNQNEDKQSNPAMIPLSDVNSQEDSKLDEVYEYKIGRAKKIYRYLRSYNWPEIAIAGVLANANADSNVDSSRYEGDDIINDLVMLRTHHLNWNEYTTALFNIYSGASDNDVYGGIKTTSTNYATSEGTYAVEVESEYTGRKVKLSPSGSMYKAAGDVYAAHSSEVDALHSYYDSKYNKYEYYPGIGLFMWSGERAHNLLDFADCQHFVTDKDNDGHNDVAFEPVFQIAYMLYENKSNIVEKATSGQYDSDNYIIESGNKTNYEDWSNSWASLIVDTFSDYKNKATENRTVRPDNKPEAWDMKYCYSIDVNLSEPDEGNKNSWVLYEYFGVIVDYTTKLSNGTAETCPYNPASKDGTHKHDVIEKNYDIKLTPVYYSIRFNTASLDKTGKRANLENLIKSTKVEKFKEKFEQFASTFTSDVDYKFEEIKNISQYVNYRYDSPDEVHNISDQFPSYEYEITGYWDWICEDITTKTVKSIDTTNVIDKYNEYNKATTAFNTELDKYKKAYVEYKQKSDAKSAMDSLQDCTDKTEALKTEMTNLENHLLKLVWDGYKRYESNAEARSTLRGNICGSLKSVYDKLVELNNNSYQTEIQNYLGIKFNASNQIIADTSTPAGSYLNRLLSALGTSQNDQFSSYLFNGDTSVYSVNHNIRYNNAARLYLYQIFEIPHNMGPSCNPSHGYTSTATGSQVYYHMPFSTIWSFGQLDSNKYGGQITTYFNNDEKTKCYFSLLNNEYSFNSPSFLINSGNGVSYLDGRVQSLDDYKNLDTFSGKWNGPDTKELYILSGGDKKYVKNFTIKGNNSFQTFTKSQLNNISEPDMTNLLAAYKNLRTTANEFSKAKRSYDQNVVNKMLNGSNNGSRREYFRVDGSSATNSYSEIKYFESNGTTTLYYWNGTKHGLGAIKTGVKNIRYTPDDPYDQEYLRPNDQRGFDTYWYLDGSAFKIDTSTIKNVKRDYFDMGNEATKLWLNDSEKYLKYHHRYKIAWKNFKGASILNDTRTNLNLGGIGSGNGYTKFLDTVFTKIYDIYTETTKDTAKVFSSERNGGIIGSGNEDPEKLHIGIEIDSTAGGAFDFYTRKDGSNDLVESKVSYMAYRLQEDLAYQFAVWFYQSWKGYDFVKMTETDFLNHTDSARYWYQLMIVNNWNDEWNTYKSDIIRLDRAQLGLEQSVIDQWYIDDELYTNVVESMIPEEDEEMYNVSTGTILDMYGNKLRHIGSFDNSTIADTAMSLAFPLGSYNYGVSDVTSCDQDGSLYANRCTELYVAVANTAYSILQRGTDISYSGADGLKFGGIAAPSESDLPGRVYYQKSEDGTSQPVSADLYSYSDYARVRYDSPWQALWVVIFASGRDEKFPIYTSQHNNDAMPDLNIWKTALGHLGYDSPCLDPTQAESHLTTTEGSYSWEYVGMIVPDDISASTSSDNIYRIPVSQIPVKLKPGDICVNYRNAFIYLGDAVKNNTKLSYYYKYDNTDYAIAMAMESDDMTGHGLAVIVNPPDHEKDDTSNAPLLYPASGSKSTAKDNPITTLMDEFCDEEGGYYAVFRSINDDYELTDGYQLFRTLDFSTYPDGSRRSELKYGAGKFHLISNIASDILSNNADIAYHSLSSDWTTKLDDISNEQERNIQSMRAAFFNRVAVRKKPETTP